jgi:hypothetical protein
MANHEEEKAKSWRTSRFLWLLVVLALAGAWVVDRQIQANRASALQRQMDRYYWQADKLTTWIENSPNVSHVDVNVDTITITAKDGTTHQFSRQP